MAASVPEILFACFVDVKEPRNKSLQETHVTKTRTSTSSRTMSARTTRVTWTELGRGRPQVMYPPVPRDTPSGSQAGLLRLYLPRPCRLAEREAWVPGQKSTPVYCRYYPRRRNVTTLMVGLKNGHIRKNLTQKVVNPTDIGGERKKKKKKKKNADIALCRARHVHLHSTERHS